MRLAHPLALLAALSFVGCIAAQGEAPAAGEDPAASTEEAWDSQGGNPTHATHSYLTEAAVDSLSARFPELATYRAKLVAGANLELHELPVSDPEQEALRREAVGTNWGADHPERIWAHARTSYAAGDKAKAYWYVGIVLHYVEDMGVPAHALHVVHQGTLSQKDNFELLGLLSWNPSYAAINRSNPAYASPSDFVSFSGAWAANDFATTFPGKTYSLSFFPSTWLFIDSTKKSFFRNREGRTAMVTSWALQSAVTHW
jgi:hypothetical protein